MRDNHNPSRLLFVPSTAAASCREAVDLKSDQSDDRNQPVHC